MAVRINIAGLGNVAPETHWPATKLKSVAQGTSSVGQIVLRDFGQDPREFVTGKRIEVDLGSGPNLWGGYLMRANRRFWFPVDDPDKLHRQWVLTVVDNNILFNKRIVFKVAHPASIEGPSYLTNTFDDDVIADLVADWLDLSADGIDTTSRVNRVALANVGQRFYPINGGMRWGQSMEIISWLPNAVWYLDPDWKLVYADVDDEDAPLELSDQPGPGQAGYRECIILEDGAQLANDMAGWGFGKGSNHGVFKRVIDSASVAAHGLWQDAFVAYDVWKQATIDRIVDSAINGSPSSKRGRKNDRFEVNLVTHENGFRVGQRPRFISNLWGVDDVVPIREMELTFESPTAVNYRMKLTHEIDKQWTMFDPLPRIHIGLQPIHIPVFVPPIVIVEEGGCVCGITDLFGRLVVDGWGTNDAGLRWVTVVLAGAVYSVDGTSGIMTTTQTLKTAEANLGMFFSIPFEVSFDVDLSNIPPDESPAPRFQILVQGDQAPFQLTLSPTTTPNLISISGGDGLTEPFEDTSVDLTQPVTVHILREVVGGDSWLRANVWPAGDPEPAGWMVQDVSTGDVDTNTNFRMQLVNRNNDTDFTAAIRNVSIVGYDRCSAVQFENFERLVGSGWGIAMPSQSLWTVAATTTRGHSSVSFTNGWGVVGVTNGVFPSTQGARSMETPFPAGVTGDYTLRSRASFTRIPLSNGAAAYFLYARLANGWSWEVSFQTAFGSASAQIELNLYDDTFTLIDSDVQSASGVVINDIVDIVVSVTDTAIVASVTKNSFQSALLSVASTGLTGAGQTLGVSTNVISNDASSTFDFRIAYIDFDYDGRPCFFDCDGGTPVIFDDFDRATNPLNWGSASSGPAYSYVGAPANGDFNTSLSEGVMSIEGSGLNVFFGPNGAGGGLDPGPWQSPAWTFSCWLKTPTWTYDGSDASIDGTAGIQINAESRSILLEWGTLVDSGLVVEGHGWIENDDGGIVSFDWHPDTWYELRWYYNFETGDSWVKAWVVGFTEPDWLVTDSTYGGLGGDVQPKWFRIRSLSTLFTPWNSGNPELVRFENFAFTTCEVAPPAAGEETPVSGEIIEDQTITSSTVTLGSPFVPGSTTLWVDGTLETDYTEDPTAGQITIGFAITTTLHVKVRYTVA